jgi:hypothetical protein
MEPFRTSIARRRTARRLSWPFAALAVVAFSPDDACAQASSWLFVGGGAGVIEREDKESHGALQVDAGLGTSATSPVVGGALFRLQNYFGAGADVAILSRFVSSGFARGGFGGGIDAGAYQRWWGADSSGFIGNLVLGAPWGITLLAGGSIGTDDQRSYFATLGIDLARLTVHRHSGLGWFPNPMRAPEE